MTTPPRLVYIVTDPLSFVLTRGQAAVISGAGFELHAISSPGPRADEYSRNERVPFHPVRMARRIAPRSDLATLARLCGTLNRLGPQVVVAGTPKAGVLGTIAAWMLRVSVRIYYVHGLPFLTARGIRGRILRAVEQVACAAATHVLCVSHSMRRELVGSGICPARKAIVLANGSSNGVDVSRFDRRRFAGATREEVRSRFDIPQDALVVGFIGRLGREKGIGELLGAWRHLRARCPSAYLLIVGPLEPTNPVPAATMRELAGDRRVRLAGPDWNAAPLYMAMDVFCLPSHREGCPNVLLEAAAMELPVVAFRVPGVVDAVCDGVTGRLVEPLRPQALAEALHDYLVDPARRRRHGEEGRRWVSGLFRQEVVWSAVSDFYTALANNCAVQVKPDTTSHERCTETA